jgi:hypothetical protein
MVWVDALPGLGIMDADRELTVLDRETFRPWIGAEILVEGAVLLHDHNDMLDLRPGLGEAGIG